MPDNELKMLFNLIQFHIKNHKNLTEKDVYKLLYQGAMGPKHLLANPESAKQYLQREWDSVLPMKDELLFEPVSPDGLVIRVNIRPCKYVFKNYLFLWDALYQTALNFKENHSLFVKTWHDYYKLCAENKLPFSTIKIEELDRQTKENNYPAMHHSRKYSEVNKPAYRVLVKNEFKKLNHTTNSD